ncbi:MAG TPA: HAD family hydrolase [Vicinamibacterales bacterium]|jgi:hypothetical protein
MKLSALALDYDGTIAVNGVLDASVRKAIREARRRGIAVILVTGRRLSDLRQVAGDLACFDVVVAENGAVIEFPETGRHAVLSHPPAPAFLIALRDRNVATVLGECVVESEAASAPAILDAIRQCEQPLVLTFNRGRLMVLPQAVSKSTGLRQALFALRLSIHNTIGIGDAENDHDLLDACEVGVAVSWGSAALRAMADEVIEGTGPDAVASYIDRVCRQPRLSPRQMGRRRLTLGYQSSGDAIRLAVRGRTILIAGEPGTGKSWLAGLICEQLILQGYCLCILDPEGDYRSLEALPGVITLGGEDPPPQARELIRVLRYPDVSVIIDLSKTPQPEKRAYLNTLLPWLAALRRRTGLPHKILLDEAHYFLGGEHGAHLIDPELGSYILVTYHISQLAPSIRADAEAVVMVTRETDPVESQALVAMCAPAPASAVSINLFGELTTNEVALLPGAEEAHGVVTRFHLAPRLTAHVRHQVKYLDMPVSEKEAFVFAAGSHLGPRVRTLKDLAAVMTALPGDRIEGHLHRHDFSRWIADVFRDRSLASHLHDIEERVQSDGTRDIAGAMAQAIRARYETNPEP